MRFWSKMQDKRGFALIVIVFLMVLVLLASAGMVSSMQVEGEAVLYEKRLRMAQDNARYALNFALGELQTHAGLDQRVTALADGYRTNLSENLKADAAPVSMGVYEPFWTGVWDNDPSNTSSPIWLVTRSTGTDFNGALIGNEANPFITQYADSITLVGPGSATALLGVSQNLFNVTAPLETLSTANVAGKPGDSVFGRYGYWVGDLGVKASYSLLDRRQSVWHDHYALDNTDGSQMRLKQLAGVVYPFADYGMDFAIDPLVLWDSLNSLEAPLPAWSSMVRKSQLEAGLLPGLTQQGALDYFHDFTWKSRSVLSDTFAGGLRADLSGEIPPNGTFGSPLADDYLRPYLDSPSYITGLPVAVHDREYQITGDDLNTAAREAVVGPVITGFSINFGFTLDRTGGSATLNRPVVNVRLGVEIYNPYSSSLKMQTLSLQVNDLPTMSLGYVSDGVATAQYPLDLDEVLGGVSFLLEPTGSTDALPPGRVRTYIGGSSLSIGVGTLDGAGIPASYQIAVSNPQSGYTNIPDFADQTPSDLDDDTIVRGEVVAATPTLKLFDSSGHLLYDFKPDTSIRNWYQVATGDTDSGLLWNVNSPRFGYSWELSDPDDSSGSWPAFDPRSGLLDTSLLMGFEPLPSVVTNLMHTFIARGDTGSGFFAHNASSSVLNDCPLFELPRQDLLSVSGMADAFTPSGVRWQLGRAGTNPSINAAFDRFFFSTVPQDPSPSVATTWDLSKPLPNTRIRPIGPQSTSAMQAWDVASRVFLEGGFNINSTSIDAWAMALSSLRLWNWSNALGTETFPQTDYQFVRFGQSADEIWQGRHSPGDTPDVKQAKSFRSTVFNATVTDIQNLATQIVSRVRTRIKSSNGPFTSLADFVDSGVLNQAIAAVPAFAQTGLASIAPGRFDQIAILNAIGAFAVPRSDTFLVRAYGDVVDPFNPTDLWASAYCEAVVQRFPDKHSSDADPSDPMSPTSQSVGDFGRQFRIVSFRWLDPGDI